MINWNRMSDDELEEIRFLLFKAWNSVDNNLSNYDSELVISLDTEFTKIQEIQAKRAKARAIIPDLIKEMYEDEI